MAYKMKGFPMHKGVSPMKQSESYTYGGVTATGKEAEWLRKHSDPSLTVSSDTPDVKDIVEKNIKKSKKPWWKKAVQKGKKVLTKAAKYVPVATKLMPKLVSKFIPYVGVASTAYDAGRIIRMMKDEGISVKDAIKKYYLGVEDEQSYEEWKKKNNPPAGSSRLDE